MELRRHAYIKFEDGVGLIQYVEKEDADTGQGGYYILGPLDGYAHPVLAGPFETASEAVAHTSGRPE
jgi:hypothetical protein